MNGYLEDVLGQPASLRAAMAFYAAEGYAGKAPDRRGFDRVLFAGMGSSNYCSIGAAMHLNSRGVPARTVSAGQLLDYELPSIDAGTLVVLVSQSGESGEIVRLCEALPRETRVFGITNVPSSTLGRRADASFVLKVAAEEAVSTRTYLSSWTLAGLLARGIAGGSGERFLAGAAGAAQALEAFLADHEALGRRMGDFLPEPHFVCVLGKGHSLATVHAGALFNSELAKHPAFGLDTNEFRHGPFEMVEPGFGALMLAPDGAAYGTNERMARDIAARGGKVVFITDRRPSFSDPKVLVVEYPRVEEAFTPLVDIGAVQLFANALAEARGVEIGKFRWGTKITAVL
ncbi:MAG TPA: SIS domain-containing protein [Spirochaetia bacterium]|nr:SIS domain-containing protein [Spirochaetia bacterium]